MKKKSVVKEIENKKEEINQKDSKKEIINNNISMKVSHLVMWDFFV